MERTGTTKERAPRARRKRILKGLAIALATLLVLLALVEVGVRVTLQRRGTPYTTARAKAAIAQMRSRARDPLPMPGNTAAAPLNRGETIHPYLGYDIHNTRDLFAFELQRIEPRDPRSVELFD